MRILTRKLHRAFPELDPFDDGQCLRFVKRARQGVGRTLAGVLLILVALLPLLAIGVWITAVLFDRMRVELYWPGIASVATLKWAGVAVPSLGVGPAVGYLVRDWYLRRSIRFILRTQGQCPGCGYNVLGLRLNEQSAVQCPECGLETMVDPSLGELVLDSKGRHVTIVGGQRVGRAARSRHWKRWKRVLIGLAVLVLVVVPAVLGLNEVFVRGQARRAKADLVVLEQATRDLIVSMQTSPQGPSAWVPLMHAARGLGLAETARQRNRLMLGISNFGTGLEEMRLATPTERTERQLYEAGLDPRRASVFRGYHALGHLAAQGVFDDLIEVSRRKCTLPWDENGTLLDPQLVGAPLSTLLGPSGHYPSDVLMASWQLREASIAKMVLGARAGDRDIAVGGFEMGLALQRVSHEMPFEGLQIGGAYLRLQAAAAIALNPRPDWVAAMRAAQERQVSTPKTSSRLEAGRLYWQVRVATHFEDPAGSRWGRLSGPYVNAMDQPLSRISRLGTYDENVSLVNEFFDAAQQHVKTGGSLTSFVWQSPMLVGGRLPGLLEQMPASYFFLDYVERLDGAARAGLDAVMSITEFYGSRGQFPESLEEVAGWNGKPVPTDPFSEKPMVYRVLQRGPGGEVVMYRLLSVGRDGVENGLVLGPPIQPSGSHTDDLIIVDGYELAR